MKKIGCFKKDGQNFSGTITLLHLEIKAYIVALKEKDSSRAPDYKIYRIGRDDFMAELGVAWLKHSPQERIPYLDLHLDDPSLPHSLNGALCESSSGLWYLYWNRVGVGGEMIETLYAQEELKPQLGIRPIANFTLNILRFYPELIT